MSYGVTTHIHGHGLFPMTLRFAFTFNGRNEVIWTCYLLQ